MTSLVMMIIIVIVGQKREVNSREPKFGTRSAVAARKAHFEIDLLASGDGAPVPPGRERLPGFLDCPEFDVIDEACCCRARYPITWPRHRGAIVLRDRPAPPGDAVQAATVESSMWQRCLILQPTMADCGGGSFNPITRNEPRDLRQHRQHPLRP